MVSGLDFEVPLSRYMSWFREPGDLEARGRLYETLRDRTIYLALGITFRVGEASPAPPVRLRPPEDPRLYQLRSPLIRSAAGTVNLRVVLDETGAVLHTEVLETTLPEVTPRVLGIVSGWRFPQAAGREGRLFFPIRSVAGGPPTLPVDPTRVGIEAVPSPAPGRDGCPRPNRLVKGCVRSQSLKENPIWTFRTLCMRAALGTALVALAASPALAQSSGLGTISFPNSGNEAAQKDFLDGVRLLHSFEWEDSAEAFQRAQAADPNFALAYWGESLSHTGGHHYPPGQDMSKARAALLKLGKTRAERVAKAETDREKGYLESVHILYGPGDLQERSDGYEQALAELSAAYPDDLEAAAFHALSLMRSRVRGKASQRVDMRAGAIAQRVFRENPDHPGAAHYVIHAYDDPVHAPVALYAAEKYSDIAPAAVHALHMPSHIFVQHGMWDHVRGLNTRSYQASVDRAERKGLSPARYSYHALYWLLYAYLEEGRYEDGQQLLDEFEELTKRDEMTGGMKETWLRMDALHTVETRRWKPQPVDDLVAGLDAEKPDVGHRTAGAMLYARGASAAETGTSRPRRRRMRG